jgi:hypothetical protein
MTKDLYLSMKNPPIVTRAKTRSIWLGMKETYSISKKFIRITEIISPVTSILNILKRVKAHQQMLRKKDIMCKRHKRLAKEKNQRLIYPRIITNRYKIIERNRSPTISMRRGDKITNRKNKKNNMSKKVEIRIKISSQINLKSETNNDYDTSQIFIADTNSTL